MRPPGYGAKGGSPATTYQPFGSASCFPAVQAAGTPTSSASCSTFTYQSGYQPFRFGGEEREELGEVIERMQRDRRMSEHFNRTLDWINNQVNKRIAESRQEGDQDSASRETSVFEPVGDVATPLPSPDLDTPARPWYQQEDMRPAAGARHSKPEVRRTFEEDGSCTEFEIDKVTGTVRVKTHTSPSGNPKSPSPSHLGKIISAAFARTWEQLAWNANQPNPVLSRLKERQAKEGQDEER